MSEIITKIGLSFHRTFSFRRSSVAQVLDVVAKHRDIGESLSYDKIWKQTSLGTIDAQASARYGLGLGLLDPAYGPTRFGDLVLKSDPTMSHANTQWLMHYFMTAPHHAGPDFWPLIVRSLHPGSMITREGLTGELVANLDNNDKRASAATIRQAVTAFTGSYAKQEGFGVLRLLEVASQKDLECDFVVPDFEPPPYGVVAYTVADYWGGVLDGRQSVNLECLTGHSGLAGLMMMHSGDMNEVLKEMQSKGLVELQRKVPPYQVYRLWKSADGLLDRIYQA